MATVACSFLQAQNMKHGRVMNPGSTLVVPNHPVIPSLDAVSHAVNLYQVSLI
jgi:hypothetical protein